MMVLHKALKGNQFCERAHAKIDMDRPSQSPLDRFVPEAEDRVIRSWSERSRCHLNAGCASPLAKAPRVFSDAPRTL
jgi:hypothetical protein